MGKSQPLDAGVHVCCGTDLIKNIWAQMHAIITRTSETAEIVQPEQRITPMEAIRLFTINADYALFEEKTRGSIEPGKLADLIIIPDNPLTMQVEKIKDIKPEMVIRGGRVAYQKR